MKDGLSLPFHFFKKLAYAIGTNGSIGTLYEIRCMYSLQVPQEAELVFLLYRGYELFDRYSESVVIGIK
jgi:hypothetical protein